MNSFVARQPIFDGDMNLYAYELLYRKDRAHNFYDEANNADHASSKIILDSFQDIGIDKITGGHLAFVNFTANLLEQNVATLFPKEYLAVEILEDVEPSDRVVDCVRSLKDMGYLIVLDDFVYAPEYRVLVRLADIIKIDVLNSAPEAVRKSIAHVNTKKVKLLAEKVETHEAFEKAKAMGFAYFQGYFFSKPVIIAGKSMDPLKLSYLQLMRSVWGKELDYSMISGIIKRDVALSYKMLRLVNSVYYAQRRRIKDIMHALVLLGESEIRKWVSLVVMAGCNESKPDELVRESMMRAHFMELMGARKGLPHGEKEQLFLTGLFSLIDVMMDRSMEDVMAQLSVPPAVEEALTRHSGDAAHLLDLTIAYTQGRWEQMPEMCAAAGINEDDLPQIYLETINWCDQLQV